MAPQVLATTLKVLIIEDSPEDRFVIKRYLKQDPIYAYWFEETEYGQRGLDICLNTNPDLIILDYRLPDLTGLEFLEGLTNQGRELVCPIILLSGLDSQNIAEECRKYGVQNYLVKDDLSLQHLYQTVHSSMLSFQRDIQEHYRQHNQILESISDGFYALDREERFTYLNSKVESLWGKRREEAVGRRLLEVFPAFETMPAYAPIHQALIEQKPVQFESFLPVSQIWSKISVYPSGGGISVYYQDITEQKLAEEQKLHWQEELEKQVAERTLILAAEIEQRRSAEKELRKSQELYRSVLEAMSEGLVVHTLDGSIIAANRSAERILGIPTSEINGRTSFDQRWQAIHLDGTPFPGETHPAMVTLQTGRPRTGEIMGLRWPDGRLRWIEINSEPLLQPDKTTLRGVVATFSDITERKLAEEALRENEEQYHSLYDNNFYGVILGTVDGQILAANKATCQLLGYNEQELRVLGRQGIMEPVTRRVEISPDQLEPEMKIQLEGVLIHKNGSRLICEFAVSHFLDRDGQGRVCVVFQDITERKKLEEALQASEERFRVAQENSPDGFTIMRSIRNEEGRMAGLEVIYANYAAAAMIALKPEDMVGHRFIRGQAEGHYKKALEHYTVLIETGTPYHNIDEFDFVGYKGWVETTAVKLGDGVAVTARDITRQKRAEKALQESEERFRVAQENSPDSFSIMRSLRNEQNQITGFEIIYANPAAAEFLGFKPKELVGYQFLVDQMAGYMKDLIGHYISVVETGTVYHGTYEFDYRGHHGWIENTTVKLGDGIAVSVRDITRQKEAEEAINRREREFRTLAENLPDMVIRTDLDLQILYANSAAVQFIGESLEKVQGKTVPQTGYPSTQWDKILELRDKMLKTGLPQKAAAEVWRAGGSLVYIETQLIPELNTAGQPETILVIARDLTELRKAQDELVSQERFKSLFELSPDGVVLYDRTGKTVDCNQALVALAGLPRESMLGKSAADLGYLDREEMERIIGQAIQNHDRAETLTRDLEVVRPDQTKITVAVKLQTVMLYDQVHFMCTIRDITFRKQMEDELRQALEQQRELIEMKSRFISTISHEFRTPLAVIQAIGESFDKYLERMTPVQIRERVEKIKAQISNITKLLNDVLAYNQLQAGIQGYNPIAGDLLGFSRDLLEELMELDRNQHLFRLLLPQTTLEVSFDQVLMKQVLSNLVSNAIKYSVVGTEIEFELEDEGDQVMIRVTDQGIGIPERDQANIFEAFSRAGNVGTIQGTGMGLAVLKEAVNLAGGRVSFTSHEGQGTTFIVTLPVSR